MSSSSASASAPAPSGSPGTLAEVIDRMYRIEEALPGGDGVRWFNRLYLRTTEAVYRAVDGGAFHDRPFMERLDVVFANLYFAALARYDADPDGAPRAWAALFEARHRPDLAPIQLALAGMNAHINFDLGLALVATCEERQLAPDRGSPQHEDFLRINDVLARTEGEVKGFLERGFARDLDRALGAVDDAAGLWSIVQARNAAWTQGETLWALRAHDAVSAALVESLDRLVGFAGRGLLLLKGV